jgi:hypothetical protein
MAVQDDEREEHLIELFGLTRPEGATRGGTDAVLHLAGVDVPFELKSTSTTSVTTVRDFSADHIQKWKGKHWLIGFYDENGKKLKYCLYGAPIAMRPWIAAKERYISTDVALAEHVGALIDKQVMGAVLGDKCNYTLADAKALQKKQLSTQEYHDRMDLSDGYSPDAMLQMLKERATYLIERGSTLNNPHINGSYFSGASGPGTDDGPTSWLKLDMERPEQHLRELVDSAIKHEAKLTTDEKRRVEQAEEKALLDPENSDL